MRGLPRARWAKTPKAARAAERLFGVMKQWQSGTADNPYQLGQL